VIIYAAIYTSIHILALGVTIGEGNPDRVVSVLIRLTLAAPLLGRIFGWW
jgi:hypothetical protein